MNLASNTAPVPSTRPSQRRRHPPQRRMAYLALDIPKDLIFDLGEHFEYRRRFPYDLERSFALRNGFARVLSMLQRILIATGSARAWRATMHPTPCFASHRRGHARFAGTRLGPTAPARQHRACVTRMIAGHFFAGAGHEPALAPSASYFHPKRAPYLRITPELFSRLKKLGMSHPRL